MLSELDREGFKARLRQTLKSREMTQHELAEKCGVSDQAVNGWLQTGKISLESLHAVAQALKVSMDFLMVGTEMPTPEPLGHQEEVLLGYFKYMKGEARIAFLGHARLWRWVSADGAAADHLGPVSQEKGRGKRNE